MRALAIDFEKANENSSSACAIGLAWVERGKVTKRVGRLIRPKEMRFGFHQSRVHHIRPEDVENAPEFPEAIQEYLSEISGSLLLAHNASVDVAVLGSALAAYGRKVPEFSYLCTLEIAKNVWPNASAFDLPSLSRRLGFSFRPHDAGEDAFACASVALAAAKEVGAKDFVDLADRLRLEIGKVDAGSFDGVRLGPSSRASGNDLHFVVKGRSGARYEIIGVMHSGHCVVRCSCPAGQNNRNCWHVNALLDGDVTNLLTGDCADVEKLSKMVAEFGRGYSFRQA